MGTKRAGRIVVGVANTLAGYEALRFAVEQARQRAAPLIAVRSLPANRTEPFEWRAALAEQAKLEIIEAFREALGGVPADLTVQAVTEVGPAAVLLTETADCPDDLLVIGGPGGRGRRRWRPTGQVVKQCSRLARCPVTVVPAPSLARAKSVHHLGRGMIDDAERFLRSRLSGG